ncbi:MAG: hypothetical protein ABF659_09240 [Acetobacter orientalis]
MGKSNFLLVEKTKNIFMLICFSLLIFLRLPNVILNGRFYSEEGMIFFAYAWHFPSCISLWRPFAGYLNLAANASTFLDAYLVRSNFISLETAPYITIIIAFLFQIQSAIIILWGKAHWLNAKYIKPLLLLVIALCPFSEEVWLNVLHIQYQLILCCGLILALDTPKGLGFWLYQGFILIFAPLCGPGAIALGPLFLLRSVLDKSWFRFLQTILLGLGSLIQLSLFFSHSIVRGNFLNPFTIISILFMRMGIYPVFGSGFGRFLAKLFEYYHNNGGLYQIIIYSIGVLFFFILFFLAWRYKNISVCWFIGVALSIAIISFGGGMISASANSWFNARDGERYGFIPLVFWEMAVIVLFCNTVKKTKYFFGSICFLMIFVAFKSYIKPIYSIEFGPDWRREVKTWRYDHSYPLKVWGWPPSSGMNLADVDLRCPEVSLKTASYNDPTYCETNWIAHVLALPR